MEGGTPYNSIYEVIGGGKRSNRSSNETEDLVCCSHGTKCDFSHQEKSVVIDMDAEDEEEGRYVNLVDQSKDERDSQLNSVRKQLENLEMGKNPRQNKKEKKETNRLVKKEDLAETGTIPPYNSIYETVECGNRRRSSEGEKVTACCAHGSKCCASPEENGDDLLNSAVKQLEGLETEKNRRKKKEKKKSKEDEDEVFPRKPIRVVQPQNESKSKNSSKKKKSKESGNGRRVLLEERSRAEREIEELLGENSDLFWENYIGAMAFEEAEELVKQKMDFRLYHRLESPFSVDDLEVHSSLHFIYRTIHGYHRHYPIRKLTVDDHCLFYVDYGNPRAEGHPTLDQLIRFYRNNFDKYKLNSDIARDQ